LVDYCVEVVCCGSLDDVIGSVVCDVLRWYAVVWVVVLLGLLVLWWLDFVVVDDGFDVVVLDVFDGVVIVSVVVVVEMGTIVFDGLLDCGWWVISFVFDLYVCVVWVSDIVEMVFEGLVLFDLIWLLMFISGFSATSDIELDWVEGVYGLCMFVVIFVG